MRKRRRDLFPPDRWLQARIALSILATAALYALPLGTLVWVAPLSEDVLLTGVVVLIGVGVMGARAARLPPSRGLAPGELEAAQQRIGAQVSRLCLLADLPQPRITIEYTDVPLSWITQRPVATVPPTPSNLHVTTGLLDRVSEDQLAAVVGHELSHLGNGDAWFMTVIGGPPSLVLQGILVIWEDREREADWVARLFLLAIISFWSIAAAFALPAALAARIASRARELAADRGAAALTGSPATVAQMLLHLSGEIRRIPTTDLRKAWGRDLFYLLPARPEETRRFHGLLATHPPLARRVAELEQMEHALHAARPTLAQ